MTAPPYRFSTAPLMDWSDRHCRAFWRLLTQRARLYTEMITTGAILYGDADRHLRLQADGNTALQLGGSNPQDLARSVAVAARYGYAEYNLNCGCPSDRVQEGRFGACLMKEPEVVADCVRAMQAESAQPVTVKHRIGVDDSEDYPFLQRFVATVAEAGCKTFIVHARKAWLKGLSPKENREIPPLTFEHVYRLKQEFPELTILINGGIQTHGDAASHLPQVDGVMLGRSPYENPWLLADVDPIYYGAPATMRSREQVLRAYRPYIEAELAAGTPLAAMTRHVLGLYRGQAGGRAFRRVLSEGAHKPGAGWPLLESAIAAVAAAEQALADKAQYLKPPESING